MMEVKLDTSKHTSILPPGRTWASWLTPSPSIAPEGGAEGGAPPSSGWGDASSLGSYRIIDTGMIGASFL